jgi:hypothetical protein
MTKEGTLEGRKDANGSDTGLEGEEDQMDVNDQPAEGVDNQRAMTHERLQSKTRVIDSVSNHRMQEPIAH